jgi:signal transduction histidine kinase
METPAKSIRILVVDNDAGVLQEMKEALAGLGDELVVARSGPDAVKMAAASEFAVILLDMRLPGVDGLRTVKLLRDTVKPGRIPPVIFLVAQQADQALMVRGYAEGAVDFLFKPLAPELLRSKVRVFVDLHRRAAKPEEVEEALRQYNEMLELARERAIEASETKNLLLANVSHELRTPLNAILGYAELLHEELTGVGQREMATDAARIHLAAEHLLGVVNGILDLAKLESGRMELNIEEFEVEPLIRRVVDTLAGVAEKRENHLQVDIASDVGTMRSDAGKVRQVLYNLLSNACKFTDHGSIVVSASRESGEEVDCLVLRVEDTGIGIDPSDFPKLFREFTQLDSSPTRRHTGTGLGLSICERFCRMLGGTIAVESEPGLGSVFTARLPVVVTQGECVPNSGFSPA